MGERRNPEADPSLPNPHSPLLEVRGLATDYGDVRALWDVSLEVRAGEVVALLGPNGAGKTTLMYTITGLQRPSAGGIYLEGSALHELPPHRIVEGGVILVPEGRRIFASMTVLENLEVGAHAPGPRRERARTLAWVYEMFPLLAERRNQLAGQLSGGQQQMVAIGRALMGLPKLLLLDEPSLGLAPLIVRQIFEVIRAIRERGVTVLLVEQNARQALQLADRAYILEQGRIAGAGTSTQLLANTDVQRAYLGLEESVESAIRPPRSFGLEESVESA